MVRIFNFSARKLLSRFPYYPLFPDNNVDSNVYSCPYGLVCGNDIRICASEPEEPCNPACGNCTSRFACLSETTYALCFGQGYPSGTIYPCPEGQLCSTKKSNGLNFCVDKDSVHHEVRIFFNYSIGSRFTSNFIRFRRSTATKI